MRTVKANEAILCTQPEKAIARLQDGIDGGLEEAFFLAPDAVHILGEGFVGIKRVDQWCADAEAD
jgi:hypothetical protein